MRSFEPPDHNNMDEPEINFCCGTVCNKQKMIKEFDDLKQRVEDLTKASAVLILTAYLLGADLGMTVPVDADNDDDMLNILQMEGGMDYIKDDVLLGYINCFRGAIL